jgi:hypothetical protein
LGAAIVSIAANPFLLLLAPDLPPSKPNTIDPVSKESASA